MNLAGLLSRTALTYPGLRDRIYWPKNVVNL